MSIKSEDSDAKFRAWKQDLVVREPVSPPQAKPAWGALFPAEVEKPAPLSSGELKKRLSQKLRADTTMEDFRTIVRFLVVEILNEMKRKRSPDQ